MRELLTADTLAATIRMARSQLRDTFLLVEGDTDSRFFRNLVHQSVRVTSANGRENVLKAIEVLRRGAVLGVVAVVDADFSRVEDAP